MQKKQLTYMPAHTNLVPQMESDINKSIQKRFAEKRLQAVKKTTNWSSYFQDVIQKILKADGPIIERYREDIRLTLDNPRRAGLQKLFRKHIERMDRARQQTQDLLTQFEYYMLTARRSGVHSSMRIQDGKQQAADDIRSFLVQQVSSNLFLTLQYLQEIAKDRNKSLIAVPINCCFNYGAEEDIWNHVEATKMHEIDLQDAEFSLSVNVQAYPSNVWSVWVYICCFKDNEGDTDNRDDG